MSETALYPIVERFLETAGFRVKGEVDGCDVVAVRDDEPQQLAIVEMKLGFSLELLLQAVDRMRAADEVWLAGRLAVGTGTAEFIACPAYRLWTDGRRFCTRQSRCSRRARPLSAAA